MDWDWAKKTKANVHVGEGKSDDDKEIYLRKPWYLTEYLGKRLESYAQIHLGGQAPSLAVVPYFPKSS